MVMRTQGQKVMTQMDLLIKDLASHWGINAAGWPGKLAAAPSFVHSQRAKHHSTQFQQLLAQLTSSSVPACHTMLAQVRRLQQRQPHTLNSAVGAVSHALEVKLDHSRAAAAASAAALLSKALYSYTQRVMSHTARNLTRPDVHSLVPGLCQLLVEAHLEVFVEPPSCSDTSSAASTRGPSQPPCLVLPLTTSQVAGLKIRLEDAAAELGLPQASIAAACAPLLRVPPVGIDGDGGTVSGEGDHVGEGAVGAVMNAFEAEQRGRTQIAQVSCVGCATDGVSLTSRWLLSASA